MAYIDTQIEKLKQEKYANVDSEEFQVDAKRLKAGEPYEYVLGYKMFLGAYLDLSLRPMIPRDESAFWVQRAIEELKEKPAPLRLADVFAGSGNIGMALLTHFPTSHVDISELDSRLAQQIEINRKKNNIDASRVTIITASGIDGLSGMYDAIFAIPPYIPYEALPELDPEMIDYEPHLAFLAHEDGYEFHRLLIVGAYDLIKEGGSLYIEGDIDQNDTIRKIVEGTKWRSLEFWPDPYGATPNIVLRK